MTKTTLQIKILYDKMGAAERKIADFIMENPHGVIPLSITELANRCGGSEATIVRFAKKLGFEGYQQMKIALAQESAVKPINASISEKDSAFDIFEKVCQDIYCSLEKTKKTIDGKTLEKVCAAFLQADEILIFGLGNSASVAADAAHKMLRLGLNAHAYTDNHLQAIVASHTNAKSVVLGISHSGSSKDIVRALRICKSNKATTVSLTNAGESPIYKESDYVLSTVSDETNYTILGLNSRIAQLAIIDAIYSYLVCRLPSAQSAIHQTEEALQPKKY